MKEKADYIKSNLKNIHRDFLVRALVTLLPPDSAEVIQRGFDNDKVNTHSRTELSKIADFDTRKFTLTALLEEKRPNRARPFVNEGLCYRQLILKTKQVVKRTKGGGSNKAKGAEKTTKIITATDAKAGAALIIGYVAGKLVM